MSEVANAILPQLNGLTGGDWSLRFPGVAEPTEAWLHEGERNVGLFQQGESVRIVIWVESSMRSAIVTNLKESKTLGKWLKAALAAQDQATRAEAAERLRQAALPVPGVDEILSLLASGRRIAVGGGRYSETFFCENGRLRCETEDEGHIDVRDTTREELQAQITTHPDVFRRATDILNL